jgi:hypothetical protein
MCDKHIVKMILETAQLLCSAFVMSPTTPPYRVTHYNHPCAIWTRTSQQNFVVLYKYGICLSNEYTYRYKRTHKSLDVIKWCYTHIHDVVFGSAKATEPPQCMPDEYKHGDLVTAYRAYYIHKQTQIKMTWTNRQPPKWLGL